MQTIKQKYEKKLLAEAKKQVKDLTPEQLRGVAIYNKYELHDTRILVAILADLLLKHKIISEKELKKDLESAYLDELKQHKAIKK